ncbi:hypothetical protein [Collimonas sp. OK242]|jgi:hypothetical protein|uniref:hypothetical protein n=1 Tax=Collimonas sp. OK242 TaxID=1798195 RepID=UPI0015A39DB5|nr:hypothetical protein [Collimonas sp. OK242]
MTNHPAQYKLRHVDKKNKHAKKTKGQEESPVLFILPACLAQGRAGLQNSRINL